MERNVSCDVAKELLMILSYCDNTFIEKIPKEVLIKVNNLAADSNKEFYIKKGKTLKDQDLSNECKDILSELYFLYMLDSETKKELLNEVFDGIDNL